MTAQQDVAHEARRHHLGVPRNRGAQGSLTGPVGRTAMRIGGGVLAVGSVAPWSERYDRACFVIYDVLSSLLRCKCPADVTCPHPAVAVVVDDRRNASLDLQQADLGDGRGRVFPTHKLKGVSEPAKFLHEPHSALQRNLGTAALSSADSGRLIMVRRCS